MRRSSTGVWLRKSAYHDEDSFSGIVKYLGQCPEVVVPINMPQRTSVPLPGEAIWKYSPFHRVLGSLVGER